MTSGACEKCGTYRESLHRDHIIAKFLGGSDEPTNIQWLCANCHEDKTLLERRSLEFRKLMSDKAKTQWKTNPPQLTEEIREKMRQKRVGKQPALGKTWSWSKERREEFNKKTPEQKQAITEKRLATKARNEAQNV